MSTNNSCNSSCTNTVETGYKKNNSFVIIIVLYILLAIILGACL